MTRRPDNLLSTLLPYSTLVADDVIACTGGELLMAWSLNGLDFEGKSDAELRHWQDALNNFMLSLKSPDLSNFSLWTHEFRLREPDGPPTQQLSYGDFPMWLRTRYTEKAASSRRYRHQWYFTLIYRPEPGAYRRARHANECREWLQVSIARLREFGDGLERVLSNATPTRLSSYVDRNGVRVSHLLGFLASLLDMRNEPRPISAGTVRDSLSPHDVHFDDARGTWECQGLTNGRRLAAVVHIKEFPEKTSPGILNGFKQVDFEYVLTQSFSPLGREKALRTLQRSKSQLWSAGDKAVSQLDQLDEAMDQVSSGRIAMGEYHMSLCVLESSYRRLQDAVASARSLFAERGMVPVRESGAPVASFLSQFPANWKFRPRVTCLSSLNFIALSSLHGMWTGKPSGNPWGPAIAELSTANRQRFHFNFHSTDGAMNATGELVLGNTLVIGKSGTGKTALVNYLLAGARCLAPMPQLIVFDKDQGSRLFVHAIGGRYVAFKSGEPTGLNPLQMPDAPGRLPFLLDWIRMLAGPDPLTPQEQDDIGAALRTILEAEFPLRTLSNLRQCLPNGGDNGVFARLKQWTRGQRYGWVFDHGIPETEFDGNVRAFDYTELLHDETARAPVIFYLLHQMETRLDGRRTIYAIDEFWKVLEGAGPLANFIKDKQKTIRKQNGLGIFATQSPEDAIRSPIAAALIEQTATLILLPNPNASERDYCEGLKLTPSEFRMLQSLPERSRHFLVKQGGRCAVCTLDLTGLDDELSILSSGTAAVHRLNGLIQESHPDLADFRLWSARIRSSVAEPMEAV